MDSEKTLRHHKNNSQAELLLLFMKRYPDLVNYRYTKRSKKVIDVLWSNLTDSLNRKGPPALDEKGWRKKWNDWKSDIKRKLERNAEEDAMGKLTEIENAIVALCDLQPLSDSRGLDVSYEDVKVADEETPSTSSKRLMPPPSNVCSPKKRRDENTNMP